MDADEHAHLLAQLSAANAKARETADAMLAERREARAAARRAEKAERVAAKRRSERDLARAQVEGIQRTRWWRLREAIIQGRRRPKTLLSGIRRAAATLPPIVTPSQDLPAISTPTPRPLIATILDTFSHAAFAGDADLLAIRPFDWRAILTERRPDLLLVESAWAANGGTWGSHLEAADGPLGELLEWCRTEAIPTVFWNKEDPVHHERFAPLAARFDAIFTTDEGCVPAYERAGAHGRVDVLTFAAQPRLHHPVGIGPRRPQPCFAGTYYRGRDPEQLRRFEELLDAARPFGLEIYERTFGQDGDGFGFPARFHPHVVGSLPYDEVVRAYKAYRVFLNGSSSPTSRTMVPRRIPELLASGTPIVSTPHRGIEYLYPGTVAFATDSAEARAALDTLLNDDDAFAARARAGVRCVFAGHTAAHRLAQILGAVGISYDAEHNRRVTLVAGSDAGQTRSADTILAGDDLRQIAAASTTPWLAMIEPGADPHLLEDCTNAAAYTDADIIGRGVGADVDRYADTVTPTLVRREVVVTHGWPARDALPRLFAEGVRIYRGPAAD